MPKIVDHATRRDEVAAAVLSVIGRVGFEGATLREVAREAGCTTGALSHYFRDKRHLLMFAFELAVQRATERIYRRTEGLLGLAAARVALLEVLPIDAERRLVSAIWLSFDARAVTQAEMAIDHRERYRGWREGLIPLLRQAGDAGEIDAGLDLELQAENLTALVLGLATQALIDPDRFPAERQAAMVDEALAGLAAPRGGRREAAQRLQGAG